MIHGKRLTTALLSLTLTVPWAGANITEASGPASAGELTGAPAVTPGAGERTYKIGSSTVRMIYSSQGVARSSDEPSASVQSITVTSQDKENIVRNFGKPVLESDAEVFAAQMAQPDRPSQSDLRRGEQAAQRALRLDRSEVRTGPSSSTKGDAKSKSKSSASAAATANSIFLPCKTGKAYKSTPGGTMYLSIYCGRTNPRVGFSYMLNQEGAKNALGPATDSGMRWTYNGSSRPTLGRQTWPQMMGYLTGIFAPVYVDSEVTYGDEITYTVWNEKLMSRDTVQLRISGVVYPV